MTIATTPTPPLSPGDVGPVPPGEQTLRDLHEDSILDFVNPKGFGFIKDREHVKGFQAHHFHAMPEALRVRAQPDLFVDMNRIPRQAIDEREGIRSLPAMLKGYVRAGCRIGEGAVIDRQFGTTDVFIYFPLSGIDARYKSRFGLVK